ncbi:hypothetical protein BDV93DRAFT_508756 [Ceratobasidium sp. AG-I]|nr:hypothetical protein BDV93DRAFT_508756 [Ceratobasidium sp. AG-I]
MAHAQSKPVAEASSSRRSTKSRKSPEPAPRKRGGRQPGALNFGNEELDTLIDLVRVYNPLGTDAWKVLCARHNEIYERANRNWKGLKKKWEDLSSEKPPTGTAKANAYHELALEVKAELEIKNAANVLNDTRGGKSIIPDADLDSGDEEAEADEEDEEDGDEEEAPEEEVDNEPIGWAEEERWEIEQDADADDDDDADADAPGAVDEPDSDDMPLLPLKSKPIAPPASTPAKTSSSKPRPKISAGTLPFQPISKAITTAKSTPSKPATKVPVTPAPKVTAGKSTSATKATPKARVSTASKGKQKETHTIDLSTSPAPIDVDAYVEPKKRANPDAKDEGRIARKKPTYETKPSTAAPARGRQQAMDSTADRLLDAVRPEVAEEAAATKQVNTLNNMMIQNHLREISQLKNDIEQLRRELSSERDKVYQEREKVQAEREKRYAVELQLSQMQSMVSAARAYGPEILSSPMGMGSAFGHYSAPPPPRHPVYSHQNAFAPPGPFMPGYQQNQPTLDPGLAPPQMQVPFSPAASNISVGPPSVAATGPPFQPPMPSFSASEPALDTAAGSSSASSHVMTPALNEFAPPGATPASTGDSGTQ